MAPSVLTIESASACCIAACRIDTVSAHRFNRRSGLGGREQSLPFQPFLRPQRRAGTGRQNFSRDNCHNQFVRGASQVNKTELIEHIAKHADISKAAATRALESMIGAIKTTLKKGGSVSLVGFGTFAVGKRAARSGRNPRTGAAIKIKAAKVPKFRPGKALKDALN
nr:HU family DNA-binding protein [Caenimonas sedimenti]